MTETANSSPQKPEQGNYTITSVKPNHKTSRRSWFMVGLLVVVLAVVVFIFPRLIQPEYTSPSVAEQSVASPEESGSESEAAVIESPLSEAARLKVRREVQDILANVLELQSVLKKQHTQQWASAEINVLEAALAKGDASYQRGDYELSLAEFSAIEQSMTELVNRYEPLLAEHLAEGERLFAEADAEAAGLAYQQALLMAPDNVSAQKGVQRAESLPQVLEYLALAEQHFQQDEFALAIEQADAALSLDTEYRPATQHRQRSIKARNERQFQQQMSTGFALLEQQQWQAARSAFKQARQIIPDRNEPGNAIAQLEAQQEQVQVKKELERARQLEQQEQWQQALLIYNQLLKRDPSLVDPAARKVPVKLRAAIDAQIEDYLADPLRLAEDRTYWEAQKLLTDASAFAQEGSRLQAQLKKLQAVITRMSQIVTVEFISDGLTDVTIYRVGQLGNFTRKTLPLKPGKYIAAGGRSGFRDVRVEFTITGIDKSPQIHVVCTELI